jgi:hypothetical protein
MLEITKYSLILLVIAGRFLSVAEKILKITVEILNQKSGVRWNAII